MEKGAELLERFRRMLRIWYMAATMLVLALVLTVSTYAWFTTNRKVSTDRVSARSGTDTVELQISPNGEDDFSGFNESMIVQVNQAGFKELMPVSTADLKEFVYNPFSNEDDKAEKFRIVKDEQYYYHGRFYIRALAEGQKTDTRMALYLDQDSNPENALVQAEEGHLLNAARLGLTFDHANPVIFFLRDEHHDSPEGNTILNGTDLGENQVLKSSGGELEAVYDPAIPVSERSILMDGASIMRPEEPLLYMELNRIYEVDVYFYIEGCDSDCTDYIRLDEADMRLAFYGILEE